MARDTSIAAAIQQTRPFSSKAEETYLNLVRTVDRAARAACVPLVARGISSQQYNVLRILSGAPGPGLETLQVAARMVTRAPNLTRLVDKLESKKLLTRVRCSEDRRVVRLQLTDEGRVLLAELAPPMSEAVMAAMNGLTEPEQAELCTLLDRVRTPLELDK